MNAVHLAKVNQLELLDSGVWVPVGAERMQIDYTDGDTSELAVHQAISQAKDRSVDSLELDLNWTEWALEYHLSSKRANIYRGLDLRGAERVLEVGCGCGAITRFLGEQGLQVDAIEGTQRRAEIARLRSAELDNVQIVCSNYHDLSLPADAYDLIIFTGVLEYSGAYAAPGLSPEEQLKQTLQSAMVALAPAGAILIAIENRLGFKYLAGAGEDHLNLAHIGVLGYPELDSEAKRTRGIRTWSKPEWQQIFSDLAIPAHSFAYPFPDYKIPEALLSDSFLSTYPDADELINDIESRDYVHHWISPVSERSFWRAAQAASNMDQFANSFLIGLAKDQAMLDQMMGFDFVRFANPRRYPEYRRMVRKEAGLEKVERAPINAEQIDARDALESSVVKHNQLEGEAYRVGITLSRYWQDQLRLYPEFSVFEKLLRQYYSWLVQVFDGYSKTRDLLDALPQNIIIQPGQSPENWQLIDQEWSAKQEITAEQVFFRAVLNFGLSAQSVVARLSMDPGEQLYTDQYVPVETLSDLLHWSFAVVGTDLTSNFELYVAWEKCFQAQVIRPEFGASLDEVLAVRLADALLPTLPSFTGESVEVRAFWSQLDGVWHVDHSVAAMTEPGGRFDVRLELPNTLMLHRYLRLDPMSELVDPKSGWLRFESMEISTKKVDGQTESKLRVEGLSALQSLARLVDLVVVDQADLMVTSNDPQIIIDLDKIEWGEDIESITLDVKMANPLWDDSGKRRQQWLDQDILFAHRIRARQSLIHVQYDRLEQLNSVVTKARSAIAQAHIELAEIKSAQSVWTDSLPGQVHAWWRRLRR